MILYVIIEFAYALTLCAKSISSNKICLVQDKRSVQETTVGTNEYQGPDGNEENKHVV